MTSPSRPGRWSLREAGLVALGSCLLAVVATWPLAANLTTHVPESTQDPPLIAWQIAWAGHALLGSDALFAGNAFWPLSDSLAFSDALLGYAPAGLIGSGPEAAVARHNLLHLFAHALALAGTYALARALGARPGGSAVAAVAFAYAPWRLGQVVHLHVLSSGAIPLALALLVHGYRHGRPGLVLGGWLVATWQVAIGFTLGLQLA